MLMLIIPFILSAGRGDIRKVEQLKRRAQNGDLLAQYNLGVIYSEGYFGVAKDYNEAAK